jgi:hypothetical protein
MNATADYLALGWMGCFDDHLLELDALSECSRDAWR